MKSFLSILLAAGSFITATHGAPFDGIRSLLKRLDTYQTYTGTVSAADWPTTNQWWSSFQLMFQANRGNLGQSCSQFGVPNNSIDEIQDIANSILQAQSESGVDARFIFAVMLQESAGCVRAPTTDYGVRNPGLMQSHNGVGTCNNGGHVQNPCPYNEILRMVRDGVEGTSSGDGLQQLLQQAPGSANSKYYAAARMYNSGSIASSGILEQGIATHCYSSDVANRLVGWVYAQKTCRLDGSTYAGSAPVSEPAYDFGTIKPAPSPTPSPSPKPKPKSNSPSPSPKPTTLEAPKIAAAAPAQTASPAAATLVASYLPSSTQSSKDINSPSSNGAVQAANRAPGVTTKCARYYRIQAGDVCNTVATKFNTTFGQLQSLNTGLDTSCSNLWLGYDYCVQGI